MFIFYFHFVYVSVEDKIETTLDAVLSDAYCRSHMFLSKQMAKLRPELTMPMFSGKYTNKKLYFFFISWRLEHEYHSDSTHSILMRKIHFSSVNFRDAISGSLRGRVCVIFHFEVASQKLRKIMFLLSHSTTLCMIIGMIIEPDLYEKICVFVCRLSKTVVRTSGGK